MRRLIIVYNPRSSKAELVRREVLEPAQQLKGVMIGRYEVRATNVDDNAKRLAKILQEGDLVIVAGGDGTAAIGLNGCMQTKGEVTLGVLPYGNFNDTARILNTDSLDNILSGRIQRVYPLVVELDNKHWRWSLSYVTLGMMAESTAVFDEKEIRGKLKKKQGGLIFSIWILVKWYFRHRGKDFLSGVKLNGEIVRITDYMAVNGRTMARVMKGGGCYMGKDFISGAVKLRWLGPLAKFMLTSMIWQVPGRKRTEDILELSGEVTLQADGEYQKLEGVKQIIVKKDRQGLKVVMGS